MTSTTANGVCSSSNILSLVKWDVENDLFLSDFIKRCKVPHIALITKGQYLGVGAPSVASPNLKPYLYVHSKRQIKKLIGQIVKSTGGNNGKGRMTLYEQKICVPENFSGYFEILSEDGRPVKCIETVQELNEQFPELVLVRQQCKAYVPDADGELRSLYKNRTVHDGEVLTLCGQFNFKKTSFLRCFDEAGRSVYLKMNQKIKFSPVAKQRDAIAGVHNAENLMSKRLPMTVKLILGDVSPDLHKYQLSGGQHGGHLIVRLQNIYVEDVVFVYSLHKPDGQFLSVPLNAHLKVAPTCNYSQIVQYSDFQDLQDLCDEAVSSFYNRVSPFNDCHQTLTMYDSLVDVSNNNNGRAVDGQKVINDKLLHITKLEIEPLSPPPTGDNDDNDVLMSTIICDEEIDQLYDYIRGLAPLPQQSNGDNSNDSRHHRRRRRPKPASPPPPPPIDSIPGHQGQANLHSPLKQSSRHQLIPSPNLSSARSRLSPAPPQSQPQTIYDPPSCRVQPHSSTSTSPSATNSGPSVDRRFEGGVVLYGSRGALNGAGLGDHHRKLSKSTDKFAVIDEYRRYSPALANNNDNELSANSNLPPTVELHHNSHRHHYKNVGQGQSNRRRPLSMVIPDRIPLFGSPSVNQQSSAGKPSAREYRPSVNLTVAINQKSEPSYQQPYRSFVNLPSNEDHVSQNTSRSRSPPTYSKSSSKPPLHQPVSHYQKFANPRYIQYSSNHYRI